MKKIRFYRQHTPETCAISCMLMILDFFGKDFPTIGKEQQLYRYFGSKVTAGTPGAAVAYALSRRGLDVALVHSSERMMENGGGYYPEELYEAIREEYTSYIQRSEGAFAVKTGAEINCDALRRELEKDRLVILQCFVEGDADGMHNHVLHGILIYDFDGDSFLACDPMRGKVTLSEAELEAAVETPLGRMYISVGK